MPVIRQTDTTTRSVTNTGTTEIQRIDVSPVGENLLALKGVAHIQLQTGGEARLVLRALDAAGKTAYRNHVQVVLGGTYTVAMRDATKGFSQDPGTIEVTSVVLELETSLPGQEVTQTQITALEFQAPTGTPAMRSEVEDLGEQTIHFPPGGAKVAEVHTNADAIDLVPWHATLSWDEVDAESGVVAVRFMTEDTGGAYHEVFRFQDNENFHDGGVHIDQVRPGFDTEADGSFPVDKLEMWFDPGAGTGELFGVRVASAFFVGVEV